MKTLTRNQMRRFVRKRNKSKDDSNKAWIMAAAHCGFTVDDLGEITCPAPGVFEWDAAGGTLIETHGILAFRSSCSNNLYMG